MSIYDTVVLFDGYESGFFTSAGERPRNLHYERQRTAVRNGGFHIRVRSRTSARVGFANRNRLSRGSVLRSAGKVVAGGRGCPPEARVGRGLGFVRVGLCFVVRGLLFDGYESGFFSSAGERPRNIDYERRRTVVRNRCFHSRVRSRTPARVGFANRNRLSRGSVLRSAGKVVAGGRGCPPEARVGWGLGFVRVGLCFVVRGLLFDGYETGFFSSAGERPRNLHYERQRTAVRNGGFHIESGVEPRSGRVCE